MMQLGGSPWFFFFFIRGPWPKKKIESPCHILYSICSRNRLLISWRSSSSCQVWFNWNQLYEVHTYTCAIWIMWYCGKSQLMRSPEHGKHSHWCLCGGIFALQSEGKCQRHCQVYKWHANAKIGWDSKFKHWEHTWIYFSFSFRTYTKKNTLHPTISWISKYLDV